MKHKGNLEVNGKQYVLGVGGYNGNNPNNAIDIATYINSIQSGGGYDGSDGGSGSNDAVEAMRNVTYDELISIRNYSMLVPGQQYRITDYVTTTSKENTKSAGHRFDIIVTADSDSLLNENARAIWNDTDGYFDSCNLSAWEIKYCLENDTNRFEWADDENGKGVIYYMKDESGNECPYDFKNIMFLAIVEGNNMGWNYTFGGDIDRTIPGVAEIFTNNVIGSYYIEMCETYARFDLPINVFFGGSDFTTKYNKLGDGCTNNFFGHQSCYNTLGDFCYENYFVSFCRLNILGSGCYGNIFKSAVEKNTLGTECGYNTFETQCYYNSLGNNCSNNQIGYGCMSNSFGNSCNYNKMEYGCIGNSFGNNCSYNELYSETYENSFGNGCNMNKLGLDCSWNSFGNYCVNNDFLECCLNNSFGNSCNSINLGYECKYNSFKNKCDNITIGSDCYNNSFGNNNTSITIGNFCDNNNFGNNCKSIGFVNPNGVKQNYFRNITIDSHNSYIRLFASISVGPGAQIQNIRITSSYYFPTDVISDDVTSKNMPFFVNNQQFTTVYGKDQNGTDKITYGV